MGKCPPISSEPQAKTPAPAADPRLQPTPDYGSLGPASDIAMGEAVTTGKVRTKSVNAVGRPLVAVAVGGLLAALWVSVGSARGTGGHLSHPLAPVTGAALSPIPDRRQLDRLKPQKQAETLLELAVGNSDAAAVDQISTRADSWRKT